MNIVCIVYSLYSSIQFTVCTISLSHSLIILSLYSTYWIEYLLNTSYQSQLLTPCFNKNMIYFWKWQLRWRSVCLSQILFASFVTLIDPKVRRRCRADAVCRINYFIIVPLLLRYRAGLLPCPSIPPCQPMAIDIKWHKIVDFRGLRS